MRTTGMRCMTWALAIACLVNFGCSSKKSVSTPEKTPTTNSDGEKKGIAGPSALNTDAEKTFAKAFFVALKEQKAKPNQLTERFKKIITEPVFDADKAKGYSDDAAELWLKNVAKAVPNTDPLVLFLKENESYFAVNSDTAKVMIHVIRQNGNLLIDGLTYGPASGKTKEPFNSLDFSSLTFVVESFIDALIRQDWLTAEHLMNTECKARLAPPIFDADKLLGYRRDGLTDAFKKFIGPADTYSCNGIVTSGNFGTYKAIFPNGPASIRVTASTPTAYWIVSELTQGQ